MKRGKPMKRSQMKRTSGLDRGPSSKSSPPRKLNGKKAELVIVDDHLHIPKAPPRPKKRKPAKRPTKYARRERDIDFMRWVKTLPCLLVGEGRCSSVVEADHAGLDAGLNQKAPDRTCIPLCSRHHRDRHACTGFFRGRDKAWKRDWREAAIAKTQQLHRDWFDESEIPRGII